jgi:hypothetical protein
MPFATIRRVSASREREKSMKKVIMTASELGCSVIIKDLASNRSLISFLRSKELIKPCQIFSVDMKFGEDKCMEIAFSDAIFNEAVTITGNHATVIVPAEYQKEFREVVP